MSNQQPRKVLPHNSNFYNKMVYNLDEIQKHQLLEILCSEPVVSIFEDIVTEINHCLATMDISLDDDVFKHQYLVYKQQLEVYENFILIAKKPKVLFPNTQSD